MRLRDRLDNLGKRVDVVRATMDGGDADSRLLLQADALLISTSCVYAAKCLSAADDRLLTVPYSTLELLEDAALRLEKLLEDRAFSSPSVGQWAEIDRVKNVLSDLYDDVLGVIEAA